MLMRYAAAACALIAAIAGSTFRVTGDQKIASTNCTPAGGLKRLADLHEASGLAVSRTTAGRLWTHNDSGAPVLFAVDANGKTVGRVTLDGVKFDDWEALASGPCGTSACLYVGDIGDNSASRRQVAVHRLIEPAEPTGSAKIAETFRATYPDGAQDAEALLVAPDGTMMIVTKGDNAPIRVYRFPRGAKSGATVALEPVGKPLASEPGEGELITDGAISRDGQWVALRTLHTLMFYRAADFLRGDFKETHRTDLTSLREPQGEAVTFGPDNTVFVAGEGRGSPSGTLAALSCRF